LRIRTETTSPTAGSNTSLVGTPSRYRLVSTSALGQ